MLLDFAVISCSIELRVALQEALRRKSLVSLVPDKPMSVSRGATSSNLHMLAGLAKGRRDGIAPQFVKLASLYGQNIK